MVKGHVANWVYNAGREQVCAQAGAPCRGSWSALLWNTSTLMLQWTHEGFTHFGWPQVPANHHTSPVMRGAIKWLYFIDDKLRQEG